VKYGAFSTDGGSLHVEWQKHDDRLSFGWRETVSALPERVARRGFGTTVLENMVGRALGAEVGHTIHADGIEWRFDIPFDAIDPRAAPHGRPEEDPPPAADPPAADTEN
jgi:two-component sensor histidine kinase